MQKVTRNTNNTLYTAKPITKAKSGAVCDWMAERRPMTITAEIPGKSKTISTTKTPVTNAAAESPMLFSAGIMALRNA